MGQPRFSIVIPTRERADTLYHSLRTCVAQDYDNCEIIVSDNCSADHTRDVVASFNDPRVRYTNPGRRLSMCDNFEHAFEHVSPDANAICIGDDDGLMPLALREAAELISSENAQALVPARAHYDWPGLLAGRSNQLVLPRGALRATTRSTADFVADVLGYRRSYGAGPTIYQGFVSAGLLAAVRSRTGRLFRTRNPDVYSAFAVSAVLPRFTVTERCLVIDGASPRSNGAAQYGLSPDRSEATRFEAENNWPPYPGLQRVRALPVIEAEAYLYARDVLPELGGHLSWPVTLAAACGELGARGDQQAMAAVARMAADLGEHMPSRAAAWWKFRRRRLRDGWHRWRTNLYIDCETFHVKDVFGAAQLAHFARNWEEIGGGSRTAQARQIVRRLLAFQRRQRQA